MEIQNANGDIAYRKNWASEMTFFFFLYKYSHEINIIIVTYRDTLVLVPAAVSFCLMHLTRNHSHLASWCNFSFYVYKCNFSTECMIFLVNTCVESAAHCMCTWDIRDRCLQWETEYQTMTRPYKKIEHWPTNCNN